LITKDTPQEGNRKLAFFAVLYIMDNMLEENKNLKSQIKDTPHHPFIKDSNTSVGQENRTSQIGSYTKTNKLISALFMVTEVMDREEPLRTKFRNLGADIISDIYSSDKGQDYYNQINNRVSEVLSFIEIATSVGIISDMNSKILTKEFLELKKAITYITPKKEDNWLEEFMKEEEVFENNVFEKTSLPTIRHINLFSNRSTRIGVQKGSTLLQALSDKMPDLSKTKKTDSSNLSNINGIHKHEETSKKRHEVIISVIKDKMKNSLNFDGATISDIKNGAHNLSDNESLILSSCGEKTLQRELVSMVSSGVLKKTGEKRWSKYSLS
jgi:hypothetical protein